MLYLLTYDIANKKRLARLYRALKKRAIPIQYSVFLARLTPAGLAEVKAIMLSIINLREDDVRFYPLPAHGWERRLGRATLPTGIVLTMLPDAFRDTGTPAAAAGAEAGSPPAAAGSSGGRLGKAQRRRVQTGQRKGIQLI